MTLRGWSVSRSPGRRSRPWVHHITQNFYTCTNEILSGLGKMYAGGGDFTKNIDSYGGEGTAEFAHQAIEIYCK